ncbi:uncharacterized protein LOC117653053 isoform X2 [Thrips palmi]|nr:uncharacterized protein LOC117653053 isoform X2 [Thrips palmi]XP_034254300.1 uncharacterized protein LOC117653053 isoform X2 [Thrips palmi]
MNDVSKSQALESDNYQTKSKKNSVSNSKKRLEDDDLEKVKDKGEKRTKRRKASDSTKKLKKEDLVEGKSASRNSSATPDSEPRQDQSDSPITDDVFEGSNSSLESNEVLSMGSLLKSVLDRKKKLLLESDEIQQFFKEHMVKQERWDGPS